MSQPSVCRSLWAVTDALVNISKNYIFLPRDDEIQSVSLEHYSIYRPESKIWPVLQKWIFNLIAFRLKLILPCLLLSQSALIRHRLFPLSMRLGITNVIVHTVGGWEMSIPLGATTCFNSVYTINIAFDKHVIYECIHV